MEYLCTYGNIFVKAERINLVKCNNNTEKFLSEVNEFKDAFKENIFLTIFNVLSKL